MQQIHSLPKGHRIDTFKVEMGRRIVTVAEVVYVRTGHVQARGAAIRMPRDRFNRELGETIASGRALSNYWSNRNGEK